MITYAQAMAIDVSGTWNAATNVVSTPHIAGLHDWYTPTETLYAVAVAGTTLLGGVSTWYVGDYAYCDGDLWHRIQNLADAIATATTVGAVKPDNITTFVDSNGVLSSVGGGGGGSTDSVIVAADYVPINDGSHVNIGQTTTVALGVLQGQINATANTYIPITFSSNQNVNTAGMLLLTPYIYENNGVAVCTLTFINGATLRNPPILNGSPITAGLNQGETMTFIKQLDNTILVN